MESSKKNRALHINYETLATLALAQEGILGSVDKLMNKEEAQIANTKGFYKNQPMPISFILAPSGEQNQKNIKNAKKGEILDLVVNRDIVGHVEVEGSHSIDKYNRVKRIFGVYDEQELTVKKTLHSFGDFAVSGKFKVNYDRPKKDKIRIQDAIKNANAKKITGLLFGTKPFNRAHERLIRTTLEKADLIVIFLMRPFVTDGISYSIREKTLKYFIDTYMPKGKVLIVPLETSHMFSENTNLILQCIIAANFGCTKFVIGHNHYGIGMYYDHNQPHFALDNYKEHLPLEVVVVSEYVFCNECKTLVSTTTCPHGSHHHIKYHGKSLKELLLLGILPPALFIRRDISSIILSELFPKRFKNIQYIYDNLFPNNGLLEEHSEKDFYETLIKLHQTTSMV